MVSTQLKIEKKSNWIIFPKIRDENRKVFDVATNEFNRIQAPGISLDFWHNSCPSITPNTVTPWVLQEDIITPGGVNVNIHQQVPDSTKGYQQDLPTGDRDWGTSNYPLMTPSKRCLEKANFWSIAPHHVLVPKEAHDGNLRACADCTAGPFFKVIFSRWYTNIYIQQMHLDVHILKYYPI